MSVTAEAVKLLRERTGAGMMECKKALVETQGDLDAAAELMRKAGLAKADKKAARVAAEGAIVIEASPDGKRAVIVEINCETDFVAREKDFQAFAANVAKVALARQPATLEALSAEAYEGSQSIEEARRALIAKIGENITVRRFAALQAEGVIGTYLHQQGGRPKAAIVAVTGGNEAVAKDIAMHVAATNPAHLSADSVPAEVIDKERNFLIEQAKGENKPEAIVAKMVDGRVRKWLAEITLLGQPFIKDPDTTVEKYLSQAGATVTGFVRFEAGEGIEKKQEDFAAEVMKQVRGS
jgi:elongation factor Ts